MVSWDAGKQAIYFFIFFPELYYKRNAIGQFFLKKGEELLDMPRPIILFHWKFHPHFE